MSGAEQGAPRSTMSIGEVLSSLKAEHPDISVSKIRFLEAEGLIAPERTPSGYRKFSRADLERLRTILKLQRDSYLPLKVIREHLAALDAGLHPPTPVATAQAAPAAPLAAVPDVAPAAHAAGDELAGDVPRINLTESDLADQTGLEIGQVRALRDFGVICEHSSNGATYFDEHDLAVGTVARDMLKLGIEPRHLKTMRRAAEQEAVLYEQLVTPGMRNRKPEARQQATETLRELLGLSRRLRQAFVRQYVRSSLDGDR